MGFVCITHDLIIGKEGVGKGPYRIHIIRGTKVSLILFGYIPSSVVQMQWYSYTQCSRLLLQSKLSVLKPSERVTHILWMNSKIFLSKQIESTWLDLNRTEQSSKLDPNMSLKFSRIRICWVYVNLKTHFKFRKYTARN